MEDIQHFISQHLDKVISVSLTLVIGIIVIKILTLLSRKMFWKNISSQSKMMIGKGITYTGFILMVFIIFGQLGVNLKALLGAAGVLGIVLGIASQTSIGNIISGLFLISEKSFELGDLIRVGDKLGVVYSIDLLSVKLKTLDNLLIRIPNQTIITSELTNITRFPVRRMDFNLSVAYKEDLETVLELLRDIAEKHTLCLDEPEPLILLKQFGSSGIEFLYGIWFEKANYVKVKNDIFMAIKKRFEEAGIEIPFPHVSLYTGEVTQPFPVRLMENKPEADRE